ncbi:hypothetical protein LR032_06445 [Candidatus Bipolaricaulota bacterium]|nr:hypothetical protein [Candidatus Bipolaricaulota bacterium]
MMLYSPSLVCKDSGGGRRCPRLSFIGKAFLAVGAALSLQVAGMAQVTTPDVTAARQFFDQLLTFIYSFGSLIGEGIVRLIHTVLPAIPVPTDLVDPIGLLAVLTIFLAIAAIAKKLVWIVVIAGWVLIIVRLAIIIVQTYL